MKAKQRSQWNDITEETCMRLVRSIVIRSRLIIKIMLTDIVKLDAPNCVWNLQKRDGGNLSKFLKSFALAVQEQKLNLEKKP